MSYHSVVIFELVVFSAVSASNIVMSSFVNNSNSCSLFELFEIFDSTSSMYVTFAKRDLFFCSTSREKFEFFSFSSSV